MSKLNTLLFSFFIFFSLNAYQKEDNKFRILEEAAYKAESKFGKVIKESLITKKYTYKYDSKGNKIEFNKYNSDGSLYFKFTVKYEYDSKGNWIKQTKFEIKNEIEIPIEITERVLEYY